MTVREAIARIIDPSRWNVLDYMLGEVQRKYAGKNAAYDSDAFTDKASLEKADAILALTAADPIPIEREGPTGRDRWLVENAEPILEVLQYAHLGLGISGAKNPDRERARIAAIREIVGRYRRMISAAPVLSETGWRDIASAPKDGTAILAWTIYGPQVLSWGTGRYNRSARRYDHGWSSGPNVYEPELWQPLPAPPAKPSGVGE